MPAKQNVLTFQYADRWSTLMLWWKALFMVPIWGYPALPFIGSALVFFPNPTLEFGQFAVLIASLAYFTEDILKRKVKIEDNYIVQGFRSRDLAKLLSLGTDYKRSEVLPKKMLLTFSDGKTMQFKLSRINAPDFQKLLKHIEMNYPQCQIDPVLLTLVNCKKMARKVLVDDSNRFIIEYKSEQRIYKHLWHAFLSCAAPWLRFGPILVAFITAPVWINNVGYWFFTALGWDAKRDLQQAGQDLGNAISSVTNGFMSTAQSAGNSFMTMLANPFISGLCTLLLLAMLFYAVRMLLKPNALVIDKDCLKLVVSVMGNSFRQAQIAWKEVASVELVKQHDGSAKIQFNMKSGKKFLVDFSSVLPLDRPRLVRALERFAPDCTIDSALAEAMMPRHERSYTELWLQSLSTPPERNSLQALAPGQRLQHDQFVVLKRLGVGGQGTAYLCKDELNKTEVVLKETVVPVYADRAIKEQTLKRFEQEAKILQSLDCDGIVKLVDYFFEDHRGYLVLEHVDAKNLRQVVEEKGSLSEKQVQDLARQMCDILGYLHDRKIIHRDFTPDNLMLNSEGQLKLIDFNVAQLQQVGTTGTIAGKHAYLPPEQFRGKATLQSDIYAMGATLQYLLTGCDPEPISQSSPTEAKVKVSEELDQLIRDCTATDSAKRCESVQEVNRRLAQMDAEFDEKQLERDACELAKSQDLSDEQQLSQDSNDDQTGGKISLTARELTEA
ncbi:MAG TPA: serine/threonine-protein kinase [Trichormus sp.]